VLLGTVLASPTNSRPPAVTLTVVALCWQLSGPVVGLELGVVSVKVELERLVLVEGELGQEEPVEVVDGCARRFRVLVLDESDRRPDEAVRLDRLPVLGEDLLQLLLCEVG